MNRSLVIDELENMAKTKNIGIAYVYLDYKNQEYQSIRNIVASLLKQLTIRAENSTEVLYSLYRQYYDYDVGLGVSEILEGIALLTSRLSSTFIILDALDEFHEDQRLELLGIVKQILDNGALVKFFATSRPHLRGIQEFFEKSPSISISADMEDLRNYMTRKVERTALQAGLQNKIVDTLSIRAQGV